MNQITPDAATLVRLRAEARPGPVTLLNLLAFKRPGGREAFARYYVALVENADDEDDSGDEEEREEERGNAREAFDTVADGKAEVPSSKFQALMEALGTTYCEEEHRRTLRLSLIHI